MKHYRQKFTGNSASSAANPSPSPRQPLLARTLPAATAAPVTVVMATSNVTTLIEGPSQVEIRPVVAVKNLHTTIQLGEKMRQMVRRGPAARISVEDRLMLQAGLQQRTEEDVITGS